MFTVAVHTTGGTFAVSPADVLDVDGAIARLISSPKAGILPASLIASPKAGILPVPSGPSASSAPPSAPALAAPASGDAAPGAAPRAARRRLAAIERLCFSLSLDPAQVYERMADAACAAAIDDAELAAAAAASAALRAAGAGVLPPHAATGVASLGSLRALSTTLSHAGGSAGGASALSGAPSAGRSLADFYRSLTVDALPATLVGVRPALPVVRGNSHAWQLLPDARAAAPPGTDADAGDDVAGEPSVARRHAARLQAAHALFGLAAGLGGGLSPLKPLLLPQLLLCPPCALIFSLSTSHRPRLRL
jgi:hypothetical protein